MPDELKVHRRNLPHWYYKGSTYFITFRVLIGELTPTERLIVLNHLRSGDPKFYKLFAAVVMPDHVHCIVAPNSGVDLSRMAKGMKGVSAKLVNESRGVRGSLWQDESFDRLLRDRDEFLEKLNYLCENPVRKGLVEQSEDYPFLFLAPEA